MSLNTEVVRCTLILVKSDMVELVKGHNRSKSSFGRAGWMSTIKLKIMDLK